MNNPTSEELERAFDHLRLERVNNPAALAGAIAVAVGQAPNLFAFVELHTRIEAAFANGVLIGIKIAALREQEAAPRP